MAKETMTKQVRASLQDKVINTYALFGWEFGSSQVYIDDYQEVRGDSVYQVHEKNANLTFSRDTNIKNHSELVSLQRKYEAIPAAVPPPPMFNKTWLIIILIGLIAFVLPGILIIIWRIISTKGKKEQFYIILGEERRQEEEIFEQCRKLI